MKKLLLSVLLLASCGLAGAGAEAGARAQEEGVAAKLAELSGLRRQVDLANARVELMLSRLAGTLGGKEHELLGRAVREAFDRDAMHRDALAHIEKNMDAARAGAAARRFGTPLVARMVSLELEATTPEHRGKFEEYMEGLNSEAPSFKKRLELVERLDAATDASGHIVRMMSEFVVASLEAAAYVDPPGKRPSAGEKEQLIAMMRRKAADDYKDAGIALFLYAFRAVPNAELEEYVRTCETEEGRWFASVTRGALTGAMAGAGARLGKKLSEITRG